MIYKFNKQLSLYLLVLAGFLAGNVLAQARELVPPEDPRQSITYWKSHTLSSENDVLIKQTQDIFAVLLRAWDSSRLDPGLYVVDSNIGPWAASLADGNILLSRHAIEICMKYGKKRGQHLLAFVLAHELAHQRADDLWHQRFFRMVGSQNPKVQKNILRGFNPDEQQLQQLEQKEAQADHDGLIIMASVGYDPHQVLYKKDFFTEWVESIWQHSCKNRKNATNESVALNRACSQAQSRALRAQIQLDTVASQATLYQIGVQAFVARQYKQARHYFTVFGRDYPGRSVLSALAMTYLAEAIEIQQALLNQGDIEQPAFYYPLILDASVVSETSVTATKKRGSVDRGAKQKKRLQQKVGQAVKQLKKAIELEPNYRKSYLMLANAYLLSGNSFKVRGVLQGDYIPRFGNDAAVSLILAMTRAIEGEPKLAEKEFTTLTSQLLTKKIETGLPESVVLYSAFYNRAANTRYIGITGKTHEMWRQLAEHAKTSGNSLLFRMALQQIRVTPGGVSGALSQALNVNGYRLGDKLKLKQKQVTNELWIEGEKYLLIRNKQGAHYIISDKGTIINAWQERQGSIGQLLSIGDKPDRPFKALGLPDRQLHMLSGDYLAYDKFGLALHINQNQIQGWFLY
jgi:TolA-binding protein